jgi:iron complex transport system ATP-binding protein
MIQITNLTVGYGREPVLRDLTLSIPKGTITAIVGPNGCGKTTLLRALTGQLPAASGSVTLLGKDLTAYGRKELARTAALLPQIRNIPDLTVETLVQHGRYPHLGLTRRLTEKDAAIVAQAMAQTDVTAIAHQSMRELSGGQQQRAYIAMALAQDTELIALDEPTTHLDLNRQFALLELIRRLQHAGKTVVLVLHDLDHALRCSDQLILLEKGRLVQQGTPGQLLESGALEQVFRVSIREVDGGYVFSKNSY